MANNFQLSNNARSGACNGIVDLIDAGPAGGTIKIYTGSQPTDADTALGAQTLLVTFTLDATAAFGAASNGVASLDVSPAITATAVATGTAAWFRCADSTGATVFDGTVGTASSDLIINTTSITSGNTCEIQSLTVTIPRT